MSETDERCLRRAIALAIEARERGDQPYGAVLVEATGKVVAEDRNTVLTGTDITAHPELKLARLAAERGIEGGTLYTSCQPCAMCGNAIARSGISRVVFALSGEQLTSLKPPGAVAPDATEVAYDGPALFDEARVPIDGYYQ